MTAPALMTVDPPVRPVDTLPPDPRLADLRALVDSGDFDVLSLDVFDTVVWRAVPSPRDVFLAVARTVQGRGHLYASSTIASFAAERGLSEERARRDAAGNVRSQ